MYAIWLLLRDWKRRHTRRSQVGWLI